MTPLDQFHEAYFRYSLAHRLWIDCGNQLLEGKGTPEERQALLDETLKLAVCVSDTVNDVEALIAGAIEYVQSEGGDPDRLEEISLASNIITEDRAEADDFHKFVSGVRLGGVPRKPRKPKIANPFVPEEEDEPECEESDVSEIEETVEETVEESEETEEQPKPKKKRRFWK